MASTVALRVSAAAAPAHRRVTITGYNQTVTLSITSPEVDIDGLASLYAELARPGRKPFLEHTGKRSQLRRMRLTALLDGTRDPVLGEVSVEPAMHKLVALADPVENEPVVVTYSSLEASIRWNITDLRFTTKRRRQGDNAVTRCEVELEFTEHSSARKAATPIGPKPPAAPAPSTSSTGAPPASSTASAPPPRTSSTRRHTVRAGETLWSIAQQHYGDGNEWRRIGDTNGVTDPRKLAIGTVLTIP